MIPVHEPVPKLFQQYFCTLMVGYLFRSVLLQCKLQDRYWRSIYRKWYTRHVILQSFGNFKTLSYPNTIFFIFQVDAAKLLPVLKLLICTALGFVHLFMFQLLLRSASKMLYECWETSYALLFPFSFCLPTFSFSSSLFSFPFPFCWLMLGWFLSTEERSHVFCSCNTTTLLSIDKGLSSQASECLPSEVSEAESWRQQNVNEFTYATFLSLTFFSKKSFGHATPSLWTN